MPTVSEQLHMYQAQKAEHRITCDDGTAMTLERHPTKSKFFKLLMERWQSDYMKTASRNASASDDR